jgi:hypothetical protein
MIRRLRMACLGLGVFMLPACVGSNKLSDPYYTGGNPGVVLMNRPGVPPGMYQQSPSGQSVKNTNAAGADQSFRPNAQIRQATQTIPVSEPGALVEPALHEQPSRPDQESVVEPPLLDPVQRPTIVVEPSDGLSKTASPKDVIVPDWPNPDGKAPTKRPNPLPILDPPFPKTKQTPTIDVPPVEPLPPMPNGTSMKVSDPIKPVNAVGQSASGDESTLVRAMKAFQSNRPDEAVDMLKRLDPANQEVILFLMPLMVRLGEGSLSTMSPDELALLIDRLQQATGMLKSKASLRIDRAVFCRGVRKFADVDPYDPRHEYRPGDMVFLYAELKNFTCEPALHSPGGNNAARVKGFSIRLGASLELRDARNGLVWRTDLAKNDFAQTPPQDYFHTYRFCVPDKLPPGTYTLWLTIIDKPTNRAIRKPIEMRIGQG